jgi:hypothetical protein
VSGAAMMGIRMTNSEDAFGYSWTVYGGAA